MVEGARFGGVGSDVGDLGDVARVWQAERTTTGVLRAVCRLAVEAIASAEHAAITVVSGATFRTPASSSDTPVEVDEIQFRTGEGPGLDAIREQDAFVTGDLAAEHHRWPSFSAQVVEQTKVRSVASFPLFLQQDTIGALNLYSAVLDAFDEHAVMLGSAFAAHAAIAYRASGDRDQVESLRRALLSNRRIGMAIGVLMTQQKVTEEEAFSLLRSVSQRDNRKLRLVAEDVILTGVLGP